MNLLLRRREFLKTTAAGLAGLAPVTLAAVPAKQPRGSKGVDRKAVVRRHQPTFTRFDPYAAMSLGNGEFAFTADITGLQTFLTECEKTFPLCTASHWGWHSLPMPAGVKREDFRFKDYDTYGRPVGYATQAKGQEPLFNWLRQNPHRLHLGRIGFKLETAAGKRARPEDLQNPRQTLDLWTGVMQSDFVFEVGPVRVATCCHPDLDLLAVRIESPHLSKGRLPVLVAFPYGSPEVKMADWGQPERHTTRAVRLGRAGVQFFRKLDDTEYCVTLAARMPVALRDQGAHEFLLLPERGEVLEFVVHFSAQPSLATLPTFQQVQAASAAAWPRFWTEGGMIDLGGSTSPHAEEVERRMVLSLYQTRLHCAGSLPSAETGLLSNSWYGKFHLEMHWWHSVHFAAWGRFGLFDRSMDYYRRILPAARETARRQGYAGARWPKMVGPEGHDSPSPVGPLLIWQQPHPIYYAEVCYRERPTRATLERWREIVFETAEFMAAYAVLDRSRDVYQYVLGPPLKTVSENTDPLTATNPTFELAYWRFGLRVAQTWRERLGLPRDPDWDKVLRALAPLPQAQGLYLLQEGLGDTYTEWNWEHPALVGAYGMQPGDGVDPSVMRATVRRVMEVWQWERCWGWDFPLMAMAAARCGEPELAVQALSLSVPKNKYWPNGHNYQRENLSAYLPGNGGLLAALAMMARGWAGGSATDAPGFPATGGWRVRHEGLREWI
jgi:hypothetical protein